MPTVQGLARLYVQTGRAALDLAGWLDAIAMQGETPEWRQWAEKERMRLR